MCAPGCGTTAPTLAQPPPVPPCLHLHRRSTSIPPRPDHCSHSSSAQAVYDVQPHRRTAASRPPHYAGISPHTSMQPSHDGASRRRLATTHSTHACFLRAAAAGSHFALGAAPLRVPPAHSIDSAVPAVPLIVDRAGRRIRPAPCRFRGLMNSHVGKVMPREAPPPLSPRVGRASNSVLWRRLAGGGPTVSRVATGQG
jgi:hypothetical protein